MTVLLVGVAVYTILGGMLSVLVTDFLQFVVMSAGLIAVTILILYKVGWDTIVETVESNHGPGGFNPFVNKELGWSYVVFNAFLNTAAVLTWQTTIARVLAARDTADRPQDLHPHEFLLRLPVSDSRPVGHRGAGTSSATSDKLAIRSTAMPRYLGAGSAGGPDGPLDRRDAGRRYVDRFVVHAHLGQRHLQRHPGPVPPHEVVRAQGNPGQPLHHRADRRVPVVLRFVVSARRRVVGLPRAHGHDLPGQHERALDGLLLLAARQTVGAPRPASSSAPRSRSRISS